jgi:hypothetical protein
VKTILPPSLDGVDLKALKYDEAVSLVAELSDEDLLRLVDSPSIKLGDPACHFLAKRGKRDLVLKLVLEKKLKTRNGKVRAANFLGDWGRSWSEAFAGLMMLATDRNKDAVNTALLSVVLWRDKTAIPKLRVLYEERRNPDYLKAINALEQNNHRFYAKYFAPDSRWS